LWTAQLISTTGSALTSLAASILVFRLTGSALSVGLMLMATALPTVFVGLIAGVVVDRFDRKRIMIAADLIRAVLVCAIPFLLPSGVAWLYIIVMLSSAVGQFFDPAQASVLPEVASETELAAANSMMTISTIGSTTIGFAAAGLLASQFSIDWAFYLDALSFVLSAACIAGIRIAPLPSEEDTSIPAVLRNLRAGVRFVAATPILRSLFLIYLPVGIAFGLHNALALPFARRALHASDFQYSLLEGLFSVGFVVASLLLAELADRLHEGQWIALSFLGLGITDVFLVLTSTVPVALAIFVIAGMFNGPSYIGRQLIIQRNTAREMRGRVSSTFFVSCDLVFVLGMAAAGLGDLVNVRALYIAVALVELVAGGVALVLPGLRQSAAEWRRAMTMLRAAPTAPGLGLGRAATPADLDQLVMRLPELAHLSALERRQLADHARVHDVAPGTVIVRQGDTSDAAYFVLDGRTVAGRDDEDGSRRLEAHQPGDFFGEIAALTGMPRTANVVAEEPTTVLQVPAATVRQMMGDARLNRLFLSKMTERMVRLNLIDLPRLAGLDQQALRELRTSEPERAS
jgi:CRP-like cAMP-binding protein/predicted MFS family arabinose efflux permease